MSNHYPPTISVYQAAKVFGVTPTTVYVWARNGEIPSIRLGRRIRIPTARLALMLGEDPANLIGAAAHHQRSFLEPG